MHPNNFKILNQQSIQSSASGKTILIGEHAVVYNRKAIALGLPNIQLIITLHPACEKNKFTNWNGVWETTIQGQLHPMDEKVCKLLIHAFETAFQLIGFPLNLQEYLPQKITIQSEIPLGGGMGGSAAISTCLLRLACQIKKCNLTQNEEIQFANQIDCLFHSGKASGLDASAVSSPQIILFQKNTPLQIIKNTCSFWIALIDSNERSETFQMIDKIKKKMHEFPKKIETVFNKLDELATLSKEYLEQNNIVSLSNCLNESHECLKKLGVSTPILNNMVQMLIKNGALCAKLTGAGGGGLVLGLFLEKPLFLHNLFKNNAIFLTKIN